MTRQCRENQKSIISKINTFASETTSLKNKICRTPTTIQFFVVLNAEMGTHPIRDSTISRVKVT